MFDPRTVSSVDTALQLTSTCIPRPEVLRGGFDQAVFAADIATVADGTAPAVYLDPAQFFGSTYPTPTLCALLRDVLGRLAGDRTAQSVLRVDSGLGGGKTHSLIALWHAARGGLGSHAEEFSVPAELRSAPPARTAVFVGYRAGSGGGGAIHGITPQTIWGSIALQLGGPAGYELIKRFDEELRSPGVDDLKPILHGSPALIVIDEIANYLESTAARHVPNTSVTLDRAVRTFVGQVLPQAVAATGNISLVVTTTEASGVYEDQTRALLSETDSLLVRMAATPRPATGEGDIPHILARRLFTSVDRSVVERIADMYAALQREVESKGVEFQQSATAFREQVASSYPFHPDLITLLDKRLGTLPNFQRTRGALRLLALAVHRAWSSQGSAVVLHPWHLDLGDELIRQELTVKLDRSRLEPVVRDDVAGSPHARAAQIPVGTEALPVRLATCVFLGSLAARDAGTPRSSAIRATMAPGDDAGDAETAVDRLLAESFYLREDERGLRYSEEPSLNKLFDTCRRTLAPARVEEIATNLYRDAFKPAGLNKVFLDWDMGEPTDRAADKVLVCFHWTKQSISGGVRAQDPVPAAVAERWNGPPGKARINLNNMVLLAPNAEHKDKFFDAVKDRLAWQDLHEDHERVARLSERDRATLETKVKDSGMVARVALANYISVLYVPQKGGLCAYELSAAAAGSADRNLTTAIERFLEEELRELYRADSQPLPVGQLVDQYLAKDVAVPRSTEWLAEQFCRRPELPIVLDPQKLTEFVRNGVVQGRWAYHDPNVAHWSWLTAENPDAFPVRITSDTEITPLHQVPQRPVRTEPEPVSTPEPGGCDGPIAPPPPSPSPDAVIIKPAAAEWSKAANDAQLELGERTWSKLTATADAEDAANAAQSLRSLGTFAARTTDVPATATVTLRLAFGAVNVEPIVVHGPLDKVALLAAQHLANLAAAATDASSSVEVELTPAEPLPSARLAALAPLAGPVEMEVETR